MTKGRLFTHPNDGPGGDRGKGGPGCCTAEELRRWTAVLSCAMKHNMKCYVTQQK